MWPTRSSSRVLFRRGVDWWVGVVLSALLVDAPMRGIGRPPSAMREAGRLATDRMRRPRFALPS